VHFKVLDNYNISAFIPTCSAKIHAIEQVVYKFQITSEVIYQLLSFRIFHGTIVLIFSVLPKNETKKDESFSHI
jgi:hypothetical protein